MNLNGKRFGRHALSWLARIVVRLGESTDQMMEQRDNIEKTALKEAPQRLVQGIDFYFEDGLMVLTAHFLWRRGFCCGNDWRHCPYPKE